MASIGLCGTLKKELKRLEKDNTRLQYLLTGAYNVIDNYKKEFGPPTFKYKIDAVNADGPSQDLLVAREKFLDQEERSQRESAFRKGGTMKRKRKTKRRKHRSRRV